MEGEDDDDIYAPEDAVQNGATGQQPHVAGRTAKDEKMGEDLEEGEEEGEEVEEEESDSDIDIITERKDEPKAEALPPQRVSIVKSTPVRNSTPDSVPKTPRSPAIKVEPSVKAAPQRSGASYPAIKSSSIDVDAKPIYEPNGKPITEIDMDADISEEDKPWRRPGTDQTDYFNYGFDEFTWASYCLKQTSLRKEVADSAKQMKEMQDFLAMPGGGSGMPGMPGAAAGAGAPGGMPPMPGMDMPPEMQQMMATMMASGQDPTTMDPMMMMQIMQGAQGGAGQVQGQNYGGGGQGFGQQGQGQQQMGYGYGGGAGAGGGGGGGGGGRNQGGRGRGRNW